MKNYEWYGVDRKELLKLRLDMFGSQNRTIKEISNFALIQTLCLENPAFYHNLYNATNIDQVHTELKNNNWL